MKTAELTILIQKDVGSRMYVGQIKEFPAVISQGKTFDELKTNLIDALKNLGDNGEQELLNYIGIIPSEMKCDNVLNCQIINFG